MTQIVSFDGYAVDWAQSQPDKAPEAYPGLLKVSP